MDEKILIKRSEGMAIDLPHELGYVCPICKVGFENLDWSEWKGFIWCYTCEKDIPSCLCLNDIEKQIEIFVKTLNDYVVGHE